MCVGRKGAERTAKGRKSLVVMGVEEGCMSMGTTVGTLIYYSLV